MEKASRWDSVVWPKWLPVRARLPLVAQVTAAVALTALLVSPWWSAIPASRPIAAKPHPISPLPSTVPAIPPILHPPASAGSGRSAHLNLDVRHSFGSVALSVTVDGKPALETTVDGGGKRFKVFGKRPQRGFTSTIDLEPGVRVVRVRVRSAENKFDQTRIERFEMAAAAVASLKVSADKSGLTIAAERPPAAPAEASHVVPAPLPAKAIPAEAVPASLPPPPSGTQQEANTMVDLLQSLRSMLIAIAGFVASAATGVFVQEFLRSRKGVLFAGAPDRRPRRRNHLDSAP